MKFLLRFTPILVSTVLTAVVPIPASAQQYCSSIFSESQNDLPVATTALLSRLNVIYPENLTRVIVQGKTSLAAEINLAKDRLFQALEAANRRNFDPYDEVSIQDYSKARELLVRTVSVYLRNTGVSHIIEPAEGRIYVVPSNDSAINAISLQLYRSTGGLLRFNNDNSQGFIEGAFNFPMRDLVGQLKDFSEGAIQNARKFNNEFPQVQAKEYQRQENKKIRLAFFERFKQQPVPPILEIYSKVSSGNALSLSKKTMVELMNADFQKPTAKPSAVAEKSGFKVLGHATRVENLIGILNSGSIKIVEKGLGARAVYTQLFKDASFSPGSSYQVRINFKMALLDQENYFANSMWSYGSYNENSVSPLVSRGRLEYFIRHLEDNNEFVFPNAIGTEMIESIQVPKGYKDIILRDLKERISPNGQRWEDLIIEE